MFAVVFSCYMSAEHVTRKLITVLDASSIVIGYIQIQCVENILNEA